MTKLIQVGPVDKKHTNITNLFTGFTRTIHSHTHGGLYYSKVLFPIPLPQWQWCWVE